MITVSIPIQSAVADVLVIEESENIIGQTEEDKWELILSRKNIKPTPAAVKEARDLYELKIRCYRAALESARENLVKKDSRGSERMLPMPDNSMWPRFRKGDPLYFNYEAKPQEGKPCIVVFMAEGGYLVRRYHQEGAVVTLMADNDDYPDVVLTPEDNLFIYGITAQVRSLS